MSQKNMTEFEQRFRGVVAKLRFTRVMTVLGWTALAFCFSLISMACVDYAFETNFQWRAVFFTMAMFTAIVAGIAFIIRAVKHWNRSTTAVQIEARFADLGQSVRTSVQLNADDSASQGVWPSLLKALNQDVHDRTQDLRLNEAASTGSLKLACGLLAMAAIIIVAVCFSSWEWRTAAQRTLLGNRPYTTVNIAQNDTIIKEKSTFTLDASIEGRTRRNVVLHVREIDTEENPWQLRPLTEADQTIHDARFVGYQVEFPKVRKPFEYRVVAGKYESPVYRVDVQYPLSIDGFAIELTSPSYTGLGTKTVDRGNFEAVQGSTARMNIRLDHAPEKAWLELRPIQTSLGEEPEIESIKLAVDGNRLSANLDLTEDRLYQIFAKAKDGTTLRPNNFRIRVHEDHSPRLRFREPNSLVEVHGLAELRMNLEASDDYGLRKAGIVFQLNNDPAIVLEDVEYQDAVQDDGTLTPQTKAMIETMLELEFFEMSVKDSISYYAFAEDNRPGQANRSETDLHFIDIRMFRRQYPVPSDKQGGGGGPAPKLPALDEMISRERFVLNRSLQMKRSDDRGKNVDLASLDSLINIQSETSEYAGLLGDLAAQIEQEFSIPEDGRISDLMYLAQESMLNSIDSLSNSEYDLATLQERDAVSYLIDARRRIELACSGGNCTGLASLMKASQKVMDKMRRPKTDQERAKEIVRRLKAAARRQDFIMEKVTDLMPPDRPASEEAEDSEEQLAEEQTDNEPPDDGDTSNDKMDEESLATEQREVEKQQEDLLEDIEDIADMISELSKVSKLAQRRTQRAAEMANGVRSALQRGDNHLAMATGVDASNTYRILAKNIAGITANEIADRIEVARDLAMVLTGDLKSLNQLAKQASNADDQAGLSATEAKERENQINDSLSEMADRQAENVKTIEDILDSIRDPEQELENPNEPIVSRLEQLIEDNKLPETSQRMQLLPDVVSSQQWANASMQAADFSDRMDILAQRLDALYREIVSPRIEQLRKLETRVVKAKDKLASLGAEEQITRWHERVDGLTDDIESAEVALEQTAKLRELMQAAGWDSTQVNRWSWGMNDGGTSLQSPTGYTQSLTSVSQEIHRHIRELSAGDSENGSNNAVPPKYAHLTERYIELLSGSIESDEPNKE